MRKNTVDNYILPGLSSSLIENGSVRMFECSRQHQEQVTPHSHRFEFACYVLAGEVKNRIWSTCEEPYGDFFEVSMITYTGRIGHHSVVAKGRDFYNYNDSIYKKGDWYYMSADQIHSIQFSKGAMVLFFEGPSNDGPGSLIIEPVVDGIKIPTYKSEDWMFIKRSGS